MKRTGSITIMVLLMMVFVFTVSIFTINSSVTQWHIVENARTNIQSRMTTDAKINSLLINHNNFEDVIIPEIYKIIRKNNPPYKSSDGNRDGIPDGSKIDYNFGPHVKSANIRLEASKNTFKMAYLPSNYDEVTSIILRINTEYEGIKDTIEVKGKVINQLFEIKEPLVTEEKMIQQNLVNEFNTLMNTFEDEIFNHDSKATSSVSKINIEGEILINENNIVETLDNFTRNYDYKAKHLLINAKVSDENIPIITIEKDSENASKIKINGNIYCEGDLIINSPFELEGNLIVNGGKLIINTDSKPIIRGKVFYRGEEEFNVNDINLSSEKKYIYRYGSYLPGFLDIQIDVIKR
ncbi:MAG: hypothetical protein RIN55_04110 [Tissierellaceae bacterium]|nr:hypothetical protein [Tissierellaceae bacterium]